MDQQRPMEEGMTRYSRSNSPVPARRIGENPIRNGTVWPVKDATGDCNYP